MALYAYWLRRAGTKETAKPQLKKLLKHFFFTRTKFCLSASNKLQFEIISSGNVNANIV